MSTTLLKVPDVEWIPQIAGQARVAIRTNGREPMATMAAAGIGMACLPRFIGDATPGLRLLPAPPPAPERQLYLGVHRDARAVPRVKASVSFLLENVGRLQGALLPG